MLSLTPFGIPVGFGFPLALFALALLPVIWWLLRLTPPRPVTETFPPTQILAELINREETPARSPWWLTLLRLMMAAMVIFAMALPIWNPQKTTLEGEGPVLLIIDNGWASGDHWDQMIDSAKAIVEEARLADRLLIPLLTSASTKQKPELVTPDNMQKLLDSWVNHSSPPDYANTQIQAKYALAEFAPQSLVLLSDGLQHNDANQLAAIVGTTISQKIIHLPDAQKSLVINSVQNNPSAMIGKLQRAQTSKPEIVNVTAYDIKGVSIARQRVSFKQDENSAEFKFEIPIELRNEITRVAIEDSSNAGAIQLLDENNRRRLVGLISGEKHDNSQPLLSPLYYISRALEPFSDIRRAGDANVVNAVQELITAGVSTIVMADIGILPPATSARLQTWVERGGVLIRFAGPRLATAPENTLLPVRLRLGDRAIGGALSWDEPKPVAEFELNSPFYGLEPPREVFVSRQVLALQDGNLAEKTWARLSDGTPLVTANRANNGWVVLFHVTSDASWSNLPISGTFVEMLRRVVNQSHSTVASTSTTANSLPPLRLLDGTGKLIPPGSEAKPVSFTGPQAPSVSIEHPPGFYGTTDGFRALNLFNGDANLIPLDTNFLGENTMVNRYGNQQSQSLKPWALLILATLLILDCLAVLWMAGVFSSLTKNISRSRPGIAGIFAIIFAFGLVLSPPNPTRAQSAEKGTTVTNLPEDFDFSPALRTRLAYVITDIASVDDTSRAGLLGLTQFLTQRTAIEPGEPIGVDISTDELAFYPIIYWPIHTSSELPDAKTMARIDAYMKQGGSVLFDTRDQISGFLGGSNASPEAVHLQQILSNLDIPPLEPVPSDHVLTKSFFILAQFPGRYSGGELWVEQWVGSKELANRPVRRGDGVSSILITSNDLAGAWAIDSQSRPMFPMVPPNPVQREIAFRVGVNLIMYAMTGNYKSDQVHIPALLKRLGQ